MRQESVGWCLVLLVVVQLALPALALPEGRKFAVKPNANKKVIAEKNEIAPVEGGFKWTSVLTTLFNMLFGASSSSIDKIDNGPNSQGGFNWMSLVSAGVRLILSALSTSSGVDKSDTGYPSSPVQGLLGPLLASFLGGQDKGDVAVLAKQAANLVQLLSSLLEALKVSFSQRSSNARSLGSKDAFSDSAVAAVTIVKGYVNTHNTEDEFCKQRIICEANRECSRDAPDSGYLFCQLGTYAAGYFLEKTTYTPLDSYAQAGRKGRTGEDCAKIFSKCNEV